MSTDKAAGKRKARPEEDEDSAQMPPPWARPQFDPNAPDDPESPHRRNSTNSVSPLPQTRRLRAEYAGKPRPSTMYFSESEDEFSPLKPRALTTPELVMVAEANQVLYVKHLMKPDGVEPTSGGGGQEGGNSSGRHLHRTRIRSRSRRSSTSSYALLTARQMLKQKPFCKQVLTVYKLFA